MAKLTERVFSGVQPTGNLHLGNYLGALKRFVEMQATHPCIYCVVDLHAMTTGHDPAALAQSTREVTAAFLACGIDPKKNIVFNQSRVPEHAELAWAFDCVGLFNYPVLMAADILIYRATHVPVGDDQKQHLELARDIAQKFNNDYAESIAVHGHEDGFFPLPEPLIQGPATRVMSLRDGAKKMSKSDPSEQAWIALTDDADTIAQKIRRAKTDPEPLPSEMAGLAGRPEADNLVGIYAGLADVTKEQVLADHGGGQFSGFKTALTELVVAKLTPIREEMKRLSAAPDHVDAVLRDGGARARDIATPVWNSVKDILGLVR
jgi:tryptophanyl-tRNA synthetase